MASLSFLGVLVWAFILGLVGPSVMAQKYCVDLFDSQGGELFGIDEAVNLKIDVDEDTPEETIIYTLTWEKDCVEAPKINDPFFTKYFAINATVECTWIVSVNTNLTGLPDFNPVSDEEIRTKVIFEGITGISEFTSCEVSLVHNIQDINTQSPEPEETEDNMEINEGLPLYYPINNFMTQVHDKDGTSPNNEFIVITDESCPIEATQSNYTSGEYPAYVSYQLRESLDYESVKKIICDVEIKDLGTSPLSRYTSITINVVDSPDEPPVFEEDYYYTEVIANMPTNQHLNIMPSRISATDGDTDINNTITYLMTDVVMEVNGMEYFYINESNAEVTLTKPLDDDFLSKQQEVMFFVTASDGNKESIALLVVTLPPAPTTTASTTTSTTCEPCPTSTTETVTECPTETPCPSCPTSISTITSTTCEPCPTSTTETVTDFPTGTPCPSCPTSISTITSTTCEPCPTSTTETVTEYPTETPCPSCPTSIPTTSSTTSEPCPTSTTETVTERPTETPCPSCPTSISTIISTTCEPCACPPRTTETVTECPTQTPCPSCSTTTSPETGSVPTTVPNRPALTFQKDSYTGSIYPQVDEVYRVQVNDIGYEVIYDWSEDSNGEEYFNIHSTSGTITVNKNNRPPEAIYELKARATVKGAPSEKAEAKVNIQVLPLSQDQVFIMNSLIRITAKENEDDEDIAIIRLSQNIGKVCITGIQPFSMKDHFEVTSVGETTWKLKKTKKLDYEAMQEIMLVMEAFYDDHNCVVTETIPDDLLRSQALAIISVGDENDEIPVFNTGDMVVAYPTNEGLQRAVGPVITVQADDKDSPEVRYSLSGSDAAQFTVDEQSGEIFGVKSLDCESKCNFTVDASDGDNKAQLKVTVMPLEMDHVFTLVMNDTAVSEVDEALLQLSTETNAQISKLYVSPMQPITMGRVRRNTKRDAQMSLEVHVYGIKENSLMTQDALNDALTEASSPLHAEKFTDVDIFEAEQNEGGEDTLGLTVAVAVLGSLLGLFIIAGIGLFIYQKRRGREKSPMQPRPPSPISTLGNAYQNTAFEKESKSKGMGSLGHKTNGSLDGFTSVQIHKTQEGDSPPMHRSPLAIPSDTIPLRSMNSHQQPEPEGGMMRMTPTLPDYYYDSSNPTPPPPYTRTTTTSPEPSSSSSSFPIYAEIKKSKNSKPKATTSSSNSSKPEIHPRTDYPTDFTEIKPADPDTDYEELGSSKFSALKGSPPPRRSKKHDQDNQDDDDVTKESAYPGQTNDKLSDEQGAPDEKKSVAFKVMVDTKEIEAQNKGPAQRKAEAEKLMEDNRKKLREEDDIKDEDEDENERL